MAPTSMARAWPLAALLLLSCGEEGGMDVGAGGAGGAGGVAGAGGAQPGGDGGGTTAGAAGGAGGQTACTAETTCHADFPWCPASNRPICLVGQPTSILVWTVVSCEEVCGTPCCDGGMCRTKVSACAAGRVCVYLIVSSTSSEREAQCVDQSQACGGFLGNTCGPTEYCEYFGHRCSNGSSPCTSISDCSYVNGGATGICRARPSDANCSTLKEPVCGCDGVTYENDCARMAANAAYDHAGSCSGQDAGS